jgi:hypothetical protein
MQEELAPNTYRKTKRVTVLIDSRDRDYTKYPTPSQYVVDLPDHLYNVSSATLKSAELPSTYYVFAATRQNTSMTMVVSGVSAVVTIPDGNYTFPTMATALQSALATAFPASSFTVTFSATTSECTIATNATSIAVAAANATNKPTPLSGLGYYLGFEVNKPTVGTAISGGASVTSTNIAYLSPESYVVIDVTQLNNVGQATMFGAGGPSGKVFAKVPICRADLQYNVYDKQLTFNDYTPPIAKLDKLSIAVRLHDGTLVDFQGVEHSFTIELTCTQTR